MVRESEFNSPQNITAAHAHVKIKEGKQSQSSIPSPTFLAVRRINRRATNIVATSGRKILIAIWVGGSALKPAIAGNVMRKLRIRKD